MPDPKTGHEAANDYAEASVYTLDNPYLTRDQKFLVECWYQLPISVFQITLFVGLILTFKSDWSIGGAVAIAYVVGLVVAILNWGIWWKPLLVASSILSGNFGTVIDLIFAAYFGYEGQWAFCVLAAVASIGLLSIIAPSVFLYTVLTKGMNPKYYFAKRFFGITFPFEH